jgi:endonuclease III
VQYTRSVAYSRRVAESRKALEERARRIVRALDRAYPDARTALRFRTPFELLVATILSAQCTDEMVNRVTSELFPRFGSPGALAAADPAEVERIVRPTGFYRQKTRSIQAAAAGIAERFGGEVPGRLEDLVSLRGVARKTANVVLGNAFGVPGLAVDTHMARVNQRLGLTRASDPVKIEADLGSLVPRARWTRYTNQVIQHGRVCCQARRPHCEACPLRAECPWPAAQGSGRAPVRGKPGRGRSARKGAG